MARWGLSRQDLISFKIPVENLRCINLCADGTVCNDLIAAHIEPAPAQGSLLYCLMLSLTLQYE